MNVPMERNNSGSSFVTARSESWFGFGGGAGSNQGKENVVNEEPEELGARGGKDQDFVEEIRTPVRSEFSKEETITKRVVSPQPPEKEASPRGGGRPVSTAANSTTRMQDPHRPDSRYLELRPPSPSPSQMTTSSTISSSNKDLPATVASPPLPPLPPATPSASALSSPSLDNNVETDPTRLPFSTITSSSSHSVPTTTSRSPPTARQNRTGTIPRPLAIHVAASSSLAPSTSSLSSPSIQSPLAAASSFLTCPSPAPSSAATTPTSASFVGGPSQHEMTAGSRSPRSPNELRWKEAVGTLDPSSQPRSRSRTRSGGKENSRSREWSGEAIQPQRLQGGQVRKEVLPPSPPPSTTTTRIQNYEGVPNGRKPLPPTKPLNPVPSLPAKPRLIIIASSNGGGGGGGGGLRIDTSSSSSFSTNSSPSFPPSSPLESSVIPRPTDKGPKSAREPSSSLANGGGSGSSRPNLFRHHSSAADATANHSKPGEGGIGGITPSISLSSISSIQSDSSSTGNHSTSSFGGESTAFLSGGRATAGLGGDRKAVEDLDKLMQSMMAMMEGNDEEPTTLPIGNRHK